jgi:short-subunit dehydrogenase
VNHSILVAGNPTYGIAKAMQERWPSARFASRSSGFDLTTKEGRHRLAELSLEAEVFVCCSALHKFHQTLLLEAVWALWSERGKKGKIICMGSTADQGLRASNWLYPIEKVALKSLCLNLSECAKKGNGISVSYLAVGYVDTPKTLEKHAGKQMLSPDYVVDLVEWVLAQPAGVNLNSISLDPIQSAPLK